MKWILYDIGGVLELVDDSDAPARGAESCGIRAVLHRDNATTIAAIERFLAN
ncbi:hypothetical protein [Microbacterium aurugineum]